MAAPKCRDEDRREFLTFLLPPPFTTTLSTRPTPPIRQSQLTPIYQPTVSLIPPCHLSTRNTTRNLSSPALPHHVWHRSDSLAGRVGQGYR